MFEIFLKSVWTILKSQYFPKRNFKQNNNFLCNFIRRHIARTTILRSFVASYMYLYALSFDIIGKR